MHHGDTARGERLWCAARRALQAVLAAGILSGACARPQPPTPYVAECPLPQGARGYPVSARSRDGILAAHQLTAVARAVLSAWESADDTASGVSPQVRALWRLVERAEVFKLGDWRPAPGDTATIAITLAPRRPARAELAGAGVPTAFQLRAWRAANGVEDILRRRIAIGDSTLTLSDSTDSATVVIRFGAEPDTGDGTARFAMQHRAVNVNRSTMRLEYPESARVLSVEANVTLAYIVGAEGRVDTATVRVIEAPYQEFVDAAIAALARARFTPEMRDCRAISIVVQQGFNFKLLR